MQIRQYALRPQVWVTAGYGRRRSARKLEESNRARPSCPSQAQQRPGGGPSPRAGMKHQHFPLLFLLPLYLRQTFPEKMALSMADSWHTASSARGNAEIQRCVKFGSAFRLRGGGKAHKRERHEPEFKIYVLGGNTADDMFTNVVETYGFGGGRSQQNRWRSESPMPYVAAGCCAASLAGRLYLIGGHDQRLAEGHTECERKVRPQPT